MTPLQLTRMKLQRLALALSPVSDKGGIDGMLIRCPWEGKKVKSDFREQFGTLF